ncbi:MAG: TlyA family RNA methyltransferase [Acidimicrobiales bacterium]|nr:TlyA family RNA methyltransferase [Acidimicrobiales bacterium]
MKVRRRLDVELARRGLVEGRGAAREVIEAGRVTVDGALAIKPARLVDPGQAVVLAGPPPKYVSRGGRKLEAALEGFNIDVEDLRAVDVGASTGGFTDCLLQRGAASVVAIDVGRGQLHHRLVSDPRVAVYEQTNARGIDGRAVGAPFDLLVADLSFISLRTVMTDLIGLVAHGAPMVLLVKPQFEAGKAEADRGRGVIRDPEVWTAVLKAVDVSVRAHGAAIMEGVASPITGADGNVEFLVYVRTGTTGTPLDAVRLAVSWVDGQGKGA